MTQSTAEIVQPETVKIIEHPAVFPATDNWNVWRDQLAQIFSQSWTTLAHLPVSLDAAREKVESFRPNTFVLVDEADPETVLTQIHTAPVTIKQTGKAGVLEFVDRFHTYAAVEAEAARPTNKEQINTLICLSVNSRPNQNKPAIPRSIWLIEHLPFQPHVRKIAYSFMWQPWVDFFLENLNQPKNLGPVGLHKDKGKAQVFSINLLSRPEHAAARGSNTLAAYPNSPEEAVAWRALDQKWQNQKRIDTEMITQKHVRITLISDMINQVFV